MLIQFIIHVLYLPIEGEDRKGSGRRAVLTGVALLAGTALVKAQDKTTDGGLEEIEDKLSQNKKERKKSWNKKDEEYNEEKSEENIFLEEGKEEKNKTS